MNTFPMMQQLVVMALFVAQMAAIGMLIYVRRSQARIMREQKLIQGMQERLNVILNETTPEQAMLAWTRLKQSAEYLKVAELPSSKIVH